MSVAPPTQVLQVGARAPALRLLDSASNLFDLDEQRARRRQVLLFYRGHW